MNVSLAQVDIHVRGEYRGSIRNDYADFSTPGGVVVNQPDGTALVTVTVGIGTGSFGFVSD